MKITFGTGSPSSGNRFELPVAQNDRTAEFFLENKIKNCDIEISTPKNEEKSKILRNGRDGFRLDVDGKPRNLIQNGNIGLAPNCSRLGTL